MNKMFRIGIAAVLAGLVFVGCGTANIYNVQHNPVSIKSGTSSHDIYKAIQNAGASKGWMISKTSEGVAKGEINLRRHQAIVDVKYTDKDYSINYVSSLNLNSDGKVIHTNYNGWIQNLQKAINVQMSLLAD